MHAQAHRRAAHVPKHMTIYFIDLQHWTYNSLHFSYIQIAFLLQVAENLLQFWNEFLLNVFEIISFNFDRRLDDFDIKMFVIFLPKKSNMYFFWQKNEMIFFFQKEKQAPTLWSKRKHLTVWFFLTYYNKWTRPNEQDYCERNSNKKIGPNHRKCCNMRATSWNSKSNRSFNLYVFL